MQPLTRQTLRGTWAPVLLPVNEDDSIDYARLGEEVTVLVRAGLDGIYTNGTAGEFHALDEDEYELVTGLVAAHCRSAGVPFQLGASHMSGQISLRRIRSAVACEPSAIQVILPDWCPLSPDEVLIAIDGMARAAEPVPLVLYNPPHAKTQLTPELFGRLAAVFPQLVGIKVAGGDDAWFGEMRTCASDLAIFVAGHHLASGLLQGAHGSYSNIACMTPAGAVRWYQDMLTDPAAALLLERELNAFFDQHVLPLQRSGYCNAALDKMLAAVGAWAPIGTRTRWPYRGIPEAIACELGRRARIDLAGFFAAGEETSSVRLSPPS